MRPNLMMRMVPEYSPPAHTEQGSDPTAAVRALKQPRTPAIICLRTRGSLGTGAPWGSGLPCYGECQDMPSGRRQEQTSKGPGRGDPGEPCRKKCQVGQTRAVVAGGLGSSVNRPKPPVKCACAHTCPHTCTHAHVYPVPTRTHTHTCARSLGQVETGRLRDPLLLKTCRVMETFSIPSHNRGRLSNSPWPTRVHVLIPRTYVTLHGREDFARGIKGRIWRQEIILA